jgi:hypothetical protein
MNERWLVFAYRDGETIGTGLCSGNVMLAGAEGQAVLAQLPSPLGEPVAGADPADDGLPVPAILGGVAIVLVGGLTAWVFLREPRPSSAT